MRATAFRPYHETKAVVLGATGFLGRWVSRALTECQAELWLVVRDERRAVPIFEQYGIEGKVLELDLARPAAFDCLLKHVNPAIVFNLAAYGEDHGDENSEMAYRTNTRLVQNLSWMLQEDRTQISWPWQSLVHVGSSIEYGTGDFREHVNGSPKTFYGESKLAGTCWLERYCSKFGLKALIARPFFVYGPGEKRDRLLSSLIESTRQRKPLPLAGGSEIHDFTYVADIAEGLLRLGLSQARPGAIVNLATGRPATVREFIERGAAILETPAPNLGFDMISDLSPSVEIRETPVQLLRELTGWLPPTNIDAGIRATLDFLSHPAHASPTRINGHEGGVHDERRVYQRR